RDQGWSVAGLAMSAASITADKVSPQLAGTTMILTAAGTGGMTPYSFKFLVTTNNWATFSVLRDWSTMPTYAWTPTIAGSYQVGVYARSAWDTANAPEAAAALAFVVGSRPMMTGVTVSAD